MKRFINQNISYSEFFETVNEEFSSKFPEVYGLRITAKLEKSNMKLIFNFSMIGLDLMKSQILDKINNEYKDIEVLCGTLTRINDYVEVSVTFKLKL
jgi:hypothetical protein